jgi:hypothetical protein
VRIVLLSLNMATGLIASHWHCTQTIVTTTTKCVNNGLLQLTSSHSSTSSSQDYPSSDIWGLPGWVLLTLPPSNTELNKASIGGGITCVVLAVLALVNKSQAGGSSFYGRHPSSNLR